MNDEEKDLEDDTDLVGCVVVVLLAGLLVGCVILFFILGPLLFFILLFPVLLVLILLVSTYGLLTEKKEDRWHYLIPLIVSLSILTSMFRSSMSSIFDEDD